MPEADLHAMLSHDQLLAAIPGAIHDVELRGFGSRLSGKVRDMYVAGDRRILIATDRVSAFDVVLGVIPYKGQVLNQLSAWWFEHTRDIVPNHMLSAPDPNAMIVREARALPVEVVVRGYITGVTKTSLWTLYAQGERRPYGAALPDGLAKNDPLPEPIITPTTKAGPGGHDERLTRDEIVGGRIVEPALWEEIERAAMRLFARGQAIAARAGLILVDTKYEFGFIDGRVALIDEVHTPDSSRYWIAESYAGGGAEPQNYDKEYLRQWFTARDYRGDGPPPPMPDDFIAQVAGRYIGAFERLTGQSFEPAERPAGPRIQRNVEMMLHGRDREPGGPGQ